MSERRFALVDFTYRGKTGRLRIHEAGHTYALPRAVAHAPTKSELVAKQRPPQWTPPSIFRPPEVLTEVEIESSALPLPPSPSWRRLLGLPFPHGGPNSLLRNQAWTAYVQTTVMIQGRPMSSAEQDRAQRLFRERQEGTKAFQEYRDKQEAMLKLTAKLRAERLAHEASLKLQARPKKRSASDGIKPGNKS
jgi:hypothetical protein